MNGRTEPAIIVWLKPIGALCLLLGFGLMAKTFRSDDFMVQLPGTLIFVCGLVSVVTRVPSSEPTNLFVVNGPLLDVTKVACIFMSLPLGLVLVSALRSGDMLKVLSVIVFFAGPLLLIYIVVLLSRVGKWIGWEIARWHEAK